MSAILSYLLFAISSIQCKKNCCWLFGIVRFGKVCYSKFFVYSQFFPTNYSYQRFLHGCLPGFVRSSQYVSFSFCYLNHDYRNPFTNWQTSIWPGFKSKCKVDDPTKKKTKTSNKHIVRTSIN